MGFASPAQVCVERTIDEGGAERLSVAVGVAVEELSYECEVG